MKKIDPKNLTAQVSFRAQGNPPSTQPLSTISNCFPGLEFDFRNVWKNIFEGIELHEAGLGGFGHVVVHVEPNSEAAQSGVRLFSQLVSVDNRSVNSRRVSPDGPTNSQRPIEFSNALADIVTRAGSQVLCTFVVDDVGTQVSVNLRVQPIFEGAAIAQNLAEPGALSQGLCSPWQADYRECGCYYWAASRPDYVNTTPRDNGEITGQDWMQKDRSANARYQPDLGGRSPDHITYDDLYTDWQNVLKFVIKGEDSE